MVPTQTNPYSFDEYVKSRDNYDDYDDNEFVKKVVEHYTGTDYEFINNKMKALSKRSSNEYRDIANEVAKRENHPAIEHFDAYNNRVDKIIRPKELVDAERNVFSERIFSKDTTPREQMIKRFLLHHNGEAGVMCPVACTDGLVDILNMHQQELSDELSEILLHCTEGIDGDYGIGAQFMTEIQGGSNIPANVLRAVKTKDHY